MHIISLVVNARRDRLREEMKVVAVIVLSGPVGVGKTSFRRELLAILDARYLSTSGYIKERKGVAGERGQLQTAGDELDSETGGAWVADAVEADLKANGDGMLLIDSARIEGQIKALRERFGQVFHIHLHARDELLEARYLARNSTHHEFATYADVKANKTEAAVGSLAQIADLVLETEYADPKTLAAVAAALHWRPRIVPRPVVDIIVGGQYGSEGKGNVCAAIAHRYSGLVRVGGPNAGHMVKDPPYKYVQLPSGTQSNPDAKIFVAAGSTISLPQLLMEVHDCKLDSTRLSIDPQAMVIDDQDLRLEEALASIASTKQGVGSALARKILNRGKEPIFGPPVALARDVKQLATYVRDVRAEIDHMVSGGSPVLVEGTQGTALSIHHGIWPHVTSRETSAAGCIADAGLAPKMVRNVIGVYRTYPIRVGGKSGWMGREIDFERIAERSRIPLEELIRTEKGTISGTQRRIAEFDWALFRRSVTLNGVTDIALTFADYLGVENRAATSYDGLTENTREFIERMEKVAGVPVSLVSKAFERDGVLRRGHWA